MDDDDRPGARASRCGLAAGLSRESLDAYSLDELAERVALLEAEIARVTAHRDRSSAHRLAAEALFGPKPT
ncbi:MAG: DUF1192 domain-containing protein [Proteobacteria bacterium]|nr:DUF1192 domain-containing protein [Pseudomonadota bacterium]